MSPLLPDSRLYTFIDEPREYALYFLEGQKLIQELAGNATALFYMSAEGQEGRDAFLEKRSPEFGKFPRRP